MISSRALYQARLAKVRMVCFSARLPLKVVSKKPFLSSVSGPFLIAYFLTCACVYVVSEVTGVAIVEL